MSRNVCGRCRAFVPTEHGESTGHPTFLVAPEWDPPADEDDRAWRKVTSGQLHWRRPSRTHRRARRRPRLTGFASVRGVR